MDSTMETFNRQVSTTQPSLATVDSPLYRVFRSGDIRFDGQKR
jgi:hypothetical protein